MIKRLAILISIPALLFSQTVLAQNNDRQARLTAARAYIASTQGAISIPNIVDSSTAPLLANIKQRQPALFAQKEATLRNLVKDVVTKVAREAQAGQDQILADTFTVSEIRALQIFSESPVGRRVLDKMPKLTAALQPALQKSIRKSLPELLTRLQKEGVRLAGK